MLPDILVFNNSLDAKVVWVLNC